ncbi:DUF697 domain-containing protein [Alteromonas aestuariivivens]|uniref:DUF697 domain-containing protein n=1 Tax=Alteromonas aestuariivivens TaxID=1938339 RepID=A0A3D8MCN0_9ALTE|nr:DUF697 domain-containing protein [Alteromonas aestuariivivens]RDV27933.1 DUF697 domain-containing protein [Alteromonas aestuariivivens]
MAGNSKPHYRTRITQNPVDAPPPEQAMPARFEQGGWEPSAMVKEPAWGTLTLIFGGVFAFGYGLFKAVAALVASFEQYPFITGLLACLMLAFVVCLFALIAREARGYRQVSRFVSNSIPLSELGAEPERARVMEVLSSYGRAFFPASYAALCYRRFEQSLNSDMSGREVLELYRLRVQQAVEQRAASELKKESMVAGSMAFISPNHLIQTLVIIWTSLRTIRRIALVFGLRPATVGNWKLLKILAQNLAAQSIFDLATDEIANQIGGSLSAKLVENSAEAVAAGALNVRLGKALIKLLKAG